MGVIINYFGRGQHDFNLRLPLRHFSKAAGSTSFCPFRPESFQIGGNVLLESPQDAHSERSLPRKFPDHFRWFGDHQSVSCGGCSTRGMLF